MRGRAIDSKVVIGIALMVLATGGGALSLQQATRRVAVWQLDHSLSAGTRIRSDDLHVAEVAIGANAGVYATLEAVVVGRELTRDLAAQELLPLAALRQRAPQAERVTLPIEPLHLPPNLRRGERVDVWLTPVMLDGKLGAAQRVFARALVDRVGESDVSGRPSVVVAVPHSAVAALVTALRIGSLDLVGLGVAA